MAIEHDLDAPVHANALPNISLGTLLKYAPLLEQLIVDVEKAITGGSFTPPPLKFKAAGKHVEIDSVIKVSP